MLEELPRLTFFDDIIFRTGARDLVFDQDGSVLAVAGVHIRRLAPSDGEILAEGVINSSFSPGQSAYPRAPAAIAIDPDGGVSAVAGLNVFAELDSDLSVESLGFAPTGRAQLQIGARTFTRSQDGTVWFGVSNGQVLRGTVDAFDDDADRIVTGLGTVRDLSASPDGRRLLAAGPGGLEIWSADGQHLLGPAIPRAGNNEVSIAADGSAAATSSASLGTESVIYDLTGAVPAQRQLPPDVAAAALAFPSNPGAGTIHALTGDLLSIDIGSYDFLDRRTLEPLGAVLVGAHTFDDTGTVLVNGPATDPVITFHAYPSGEPLGPGNDIGEELLGPGDFIRTLDLDDSSERLLISTLNGATLLYAIEDYRLELLASIEPTDEEPGAVTARFLPDGETVVTRSRTGVTRVRSAVDLSFIREIPIGTTAAESQTEGPYVSPDGEYLLTTLEQRPQLVHLPTGTEVGSFPNDVDVLPRGADTGDRLQLITGVGDHAIIWNLDIQTWPEIACRAVGRNLTLTEWDQYGPTDADPSATCPQWAPPS